MALRFHSWLSFNPTIRQTKPSTTKLTSTRRVSSCSSLTCSAKAHKEPNQKAQFCPSCARRHFLGAVLGTGAAPVFTSLAMFEDSTSNDPMAVLKRVRPPRPDWYEELYATALDKLMNAYEKEIAGIKSELFANLRGKAENILELGIGVGPNLKYYANNGDINVFGVDPNTKMEKYSRAAAEAVGIPPSNFKFQQAVAEALPLEDASVDCVVGTLVLCSVNDVDQALQEIKRVLKPGGAYIFVEHVAAKDGTIQRFVQGVLNPFQQTVADNCHLTRNTADNIATAGFTSLDVNEAVFSSTSILNPQVYGLAYK